MRIQCFLVWVVGLGTERRTVGLLDPQLARRLTLSRWQLLSMRERTEHRASVF
jgi:hypothetical protein